MKQVKIQFEDDQYAVELSLSQADVLRGIRRTVLISVQIAMPYEDKAIFAERLLRVIRVQTYPACVASLVDVKYLKPDTHPGKIDPEMSSDDFLALPDALVALWEDAAFKLNPHWLPKVEGAQGEDLEPGDKPK